jgi:hypothetical protein
MNNLLHISCQVKRTAWRFYERKHEGSTYSGSRDISCGVIRIWHAGGHYPSHPVYHAVRHNSYGASFFPPPTVRGSVAAGETARCYLGTGALHQRFRRPAAFSTYASLFESMKPWPNHALLPTAESVCGRHHRDIHSFGALRRRCPAVAELYSLGRLQCSSLAKQSEQQ